MDFKTPTAEKPADRLEARAKQEAPTATYMGRDADGRIHYFAPVERRLVVFETADPEPETAHLPIEATDPTIETPADWAAAVRAKRGPWAELRLSASTEEALT